MGKGINHETNLVVRLVGPHEPLVEVVGERVQITMPGAVVTIADAKAANAVFRAWLETDNIARQAFTGANVAPRLFRRSAQRVIAAVLLTGEQARSLIISGRAPEVSPSGVGQVAIRFGSFTIVCDDRAAWESQYRAWREVHRVAGTIWKVIDYRTTAGFARVRSDRWTVAKRRRPKK